MTGLSVRVSAESAHQIWPGLATTGLRVGVFAIGGVWMAGQPWFRLEYLFALSIVTVYLQAAVAYAWLRREITRRLA